MKKSFDYFKTFKIITENLNSIYKLSVTSQDYSKQYFIFLAIKNEILDNLKNDFITPIERGDIFILSDIFSREICCISAIYEYSEFTWLEIEDIKLNIQKLLDFQEKIFQKMYFEKTNSNLINLCNDAYALSLKLHKDMYKKIKNTVIGNCEKPLLRYSVYVNYLNFTEVLSNIFSETGRIILNNS